MSTPVLLLFAEGQEVARARVWGAWERAHDGSGTEYGARSTRRQRATDRECDQGRETVKGDIQKDADRKTGRRALAHTKRRRQHPRAGSRIPTEDGKTRTGARPLFHTTGRLRCADDAQALPPQNACEKASRTPSTQGTRRARADRPNTRAADRALEPDERTHRDRGAAPEEHREGRWTPARERQFPCAQHWRHNSVRSPKPRWIGRRKRWNRSRTRNVNFGARTMVLDHGAGRTADTARTQKQSFEDAFDGRQWVLGRDRSQGIRQRVGDVDVHDYVQGSDSLAHTPEIWVVYRHDRDEMTIHAIHDVP